jgi:anti-anti-sigma regulatory factor
MVRFAAVVHAAGELDGASAEHLQQAADALEAAR